MGGKESKSGGYEERTMHPVLKSTRDPNLMDSNMRSAGELYGAKPRRDVHDEDELRNLIDALGRLGVFENRLPKAESMYGIQQGPAFNF